MEVLRSLAETNTPPGIKGVEVAVELNAVCMKDASIENGLDVTFSDKTLLSGVLALAVSPKFELSGRFGRLFWKAGLALQAC